MKNPWLKSVLVFVIAAAGIYAMVYVDVRARARSAFQQAEQYMTWHNDPQLMRDFYEEEFLSEKARLDRLNEKKKLSREEYAHKMTILEVTRDNNLRELPIKNAYHWYKDTYELFSPPETEWTWRARLMAPAAKELWRNELRSRNIPFQEYMLEPEDGEDDEWRMVYSTRDPDEADGISQTLKDQGMDVRVYDAPANGRLEKEGIKILVPQEFFWDAHKLIADDF